MATDSSLKPTVKYTPDARFATSFLSTKYRDRAVNGEVIMDKATGELFIKRPSDGKVISFFQNKRMINDLISDISLLVYYNRGFKYPTNIESSFCISTNYDLIAINNESLFNVITDNIDIPGTPNDINKLTFNVSGNSNGFFCRNTTRDSDKAFIEFLTNTYNVTFKNSGNSNNPVYLDEYNKFVENEKWENSNASIVYDLICIKGNKTYEYKDIQDYIRLNDDTCVIFPQNIFNEVSSYDMININIKSITYDKIHFMINHMNLFDEDINNAYNKLIHGDNRVEVAEFNITHFIDNANDIITLGNESIVAVLGISYLNKKLSESSMFSEQMNSLNSTINNLDERVTANELNIEDINNKIVDGFSMIISDSQPKNNCLWFKPVNK